MSTKARKCILKAGSFDNYLLQTDDKKIISKFGLYIKDLIKQKQADPENFEMPYYIPGQSKQGLKRKNPRNWDYRDIPSVYMPRKVKLSPMYQEMYEKPLYEKSRQEMAELEHQVKLHLENKYIDDVEARKSDDFIELRRQVLEIMPVRHSWIKSYFVKYRTQQKKVQYILEQADSSEEWIRNVIGEEEYVHYSVGVPEIGEWMKEQKEREENVLKEKEEQEIQALN